MAWAATSHFSPTPRTPCALMPTLVGAVLLVMLIYNGYQRLVFRGKAAGAGYGD
jgi:hypothetical protein